MALRSFGSSRPALEPRSASTGGEHERIRARPADELDRGGEPVLGRPARQRERGPAEGVERVREPRDRGAAASRRPPPRRSARRSPASASGAGRSPRAARPPRRGRTRARARPRRARASVTVKQSSRSLRATSSPYASGCSAKSAACTSAISRMKHAQVALRRAGTSIGSRVRERAPRLPRRAARTPALRVVGPRDARRAGRRARRGLRREARRERVHHRHALGDRSRHRAGVVVARRERPAAVERHEPERRLEADDAAERGGDPDRAARCRVPSAASARPAASAAAEPPLEPPAIRPGATRVRHPAEVRVHRRDAVRELVQVRLADVRVAGRLEPADGFGRLGGHVVGEDRRAVRRRQPGGVEEILDRERDAVRRRLRAAQGRCRRAAGKGCVS